MAVHAHPDDEASKGAADRIGGLLICQPLAPAAGMKSGAIAKRVSGSCPHQPARRGSSFEWACRSWTKQPPIAPGLGLIRLAASRMNAANMSIHVSNRIDPKRVLKLIQGKPKEYKLDGPVRLRFTHDVKTEEKLFARIEQLVDALA